MTKYSPALCRRISTSKLASLFTLVVLCMPTVGGCTGAGDNPLIGSWKYSSTTDKSGEGACDATFVFDAKTATITSSVKNTIFKGATRSMAVTYVPSPTVVFVMTSAPGHVNYNFTDKNHMYTEDAWGRCNYERTK